MPKSNFIMRHEREKVQKNIYFLGGLLGPQGSNAKCLQLILGVRGPGSQASESPAYLISCYKIFTKAVASIVLSV